MYLTSFKVKEKATRKQKMVRLEKKGDETEDSPPPSFTFVFVLLQLSLSFVLRPLKLSLQKVGPCSSLSIQKLTKSILISTQIRVPTSIHG